MELVNPDAGFELTDSVKKNGFVRPAKATIFFLPTVSFKNLAHEVHLINSPLTEKEHKFTILTMSPVLDRIEKEAFQLPPLEREQLATHLFYSIHPVLTDVDEAWLDLADQRYREILSGKTDPLSEEAFFSSVEKELGWK